MKNLVYNKSEIARKTKLSRQSISTILSGKQKNPKIKTLEKIAKAVGAVLMNYIVT